MKTIFLTSHTGFYTKVVDGGEEVKIATPSDNSNNFIDRLKEAVPTIKNLAYVASDPDGFEKTHLHASLMVESLNLDGFGVESLAIIDHAFEGDIERTILEADVVFLAGGNVPTQNKYFKEINLKSIIEKYDGVVIGMSAGSMNSSKKVYAQPEEDEEFDDKDFQRIIDGLGLVDFAVMPHMNTADYVDELGHPTVWEMCIEDSYFIPHYGICDYGFIEVKDGNATAYGKTYFIKNGESISLCENGEYITLQQNI
ncbi:MAG: Type 1 glutamine amidotransferase-like domain-containing protein [Clostridia bacterium]|nr:Type 1 glutamine amidotransferase-like domain-containing protein [Clostridia bacterium]